MPILKIDKRIYLLYCDGKYYTIQGFDDLISEIVKNDIYLKEYKVKSISDEFGNFDDNLLLKESIKSNPKFKGKLNKEIQQLNKENEENMEKIRKLKGVVE